MNEDIVKKMVELKERKEAEIYFKKREILELEKSIKDLDRSLWKSCDHDWVRISWDSQDLIKRQCKRCNLFQHPWTYE